MKRRTLFALEGPNRGRPVIDWSDPTDEGGQEAEVPGRMCYGRLKSVNRVVNGQLSK